MPCFPWLVGGRLRSGSKIIIDKLLLGTKILKRSPNWIQNTTDDKINVGFIYNNIHQTAYKFGPKYEPKIKSTGVILPQRCVKDKGYQSPLGGWTYS